MSAAGGTISVLVGTVLLRLTATGDYRRYVRPTMGPWLAVAGVVVIVLGAVTVVRALRGRVDDDTDDGDHDHDHNPSVAWLLLAPIATLLLVAPPALGSYGVDRGASIDVRSGVSPFDPLTPGAEPIGMTLLEYNQRAFDRDGESFAGATVQLTGFVVDTGREQDFRLARYQIACCAADAAPVVVQVVGAATEPARDQWVTVTGTFRRGGGEELPELLATNIVEIAEPTDPYE